MSVCCIGGVCIPYSAIVPLLVLGLKWLAEKLAPFLPDGLRTKLQISSGGAKSSTATSTPSTNDSCCDCNTTSHSVDTAVTRGLSSYSESSCLTDDDGDDNNNDKTSKTEATVVTVIESVEEWNQTLQKYPRVIVKFTASWCKPCKEILPTYEALANEYGYYGNTPTKFVKVDVDDLDEVAAEHGVAMLPTFVVLEQSKPVVTMRGSDSNKLQDLVKKYAVGGGCSG